MKFRQWLNEKWYEHLEECDGWHSVPAKNVKEYFNKYKWWLKSLYKKEMKQ